ncbi:translesion DNA synthesis-associated protein ImuA [Vibrio sp. 99-8-1]|uniref:translesion DNA synthesis-associated protein ImuA n=1 Tax=Vibrio sp. 99-8-1 TaxID=2607602 RepID=UPI0014936A14|nr:translesion DNA synthesis-associated protein ImuA [Vibrio sp. 99-8-1]NOI66354.1 translesion DNA synthesis-associated protein ImuA [Vibrio sp. 99-8-1]
MHPVIDLLQTKQLIWRGSQQKINATTHTSGYSELDKQLKGGFPTYGVIEVNSPQGIGELRLLTPYIKQKGQQRLSVFINPPGYLCSEYFVQQEIELNKLILLFPKTAKEALWAAEQCLKSGSCGSVTLWHPSLEIHQAKRLQVASETGQCLNFLFKMDTRCQLTLPISLSLTLQPDSNGLTVTIHRRKGGWLKTRFTIDVHQKWPHLAPYTHTNSVIPFPIGNRGTA